MKYIFLDFDGVLHHFPIKDWDHGFFQLANHLSDLLIGLRDVEVVISSSWRECAEFGQTVQSRLEELKGFLPAGLSERVVGMTPFGNPFLSRSEEIDMWLHENAPIGSKYLAIDDMPDLFKEHTPLAICDPTVGLVPGSAAFDAVKLFLKDEE